MASTETVKKIIESWITKGEKEDDQFNKFICNWIALNCFFNSQYASNNEHESINKLKEAVELKQKFNDEFNGKRDKEKNDLICLSPIKKGKDLNEDNEPKISKEFTLSEVIEILYQIRCNLFHGDKSEEVGRDMKVVSAANPILKIVVDICKDIYNMNN